LTLVQGDGPLKNQFVKQYGGKPNIHFLPLQPEDKLCELLNLADLHIVPQDRGAADLVLPSKLGGILASGRPVLVQADEGTELHRLLEDVALVVPAGNVGALVEAISIAQTQNHDAERYSAIANLFARDQILPAFHDRVFREKQQRGHP